jgi:tRNA uridine 5-carboxymethylaminomethyl modification enzyme
LLKRPELTYSDVKNLKGEGVADEEVAEQVVTQAKYEGYISRQQDEIERLRRHEMTRLPEDFIYDDIPGLSNEVKQKLNEMRPETLAAAGRIPGVTPAAVSLLLIHLKKRSVLQVKTA